jgi:hypothetical protein
VRDVLRRKLRTLRGLAQEGHFAFLAPKPLARLTYLYVRDRLGRRRYDGLGERELLATRSSDIAFVFGSGRSLVEIEPQEWEAMARANTISLREFPRQRWIRADYHLTSEVDFVDEYARRLHENPLYADTIFVLQEGFRAERPNEIVGRGLLPPGARVFRYRRRRSRTALPSRRLADGLVHGSSSVFDATNFAYAMGYRRIVLVGVDLYNKEYFWLPPGELREYENPAVKGVDSFVGAEAIVELMTRWHAALAQDGVELSVYNPRSLLADRLPIYARD